MARINFDTSTKPSAKHSSPKKSSPDKSRTWTVPSQTDDANEYYITLSHDWKLGMVWSCTCASYWKGVSDNPKYFCKHIHWQRDLLIDHLLFENPPKLPKRENL